MISHFLYTQQMFFNHSDKLGFIIRQDGSIGVIFSVKKNNCDRPKLSFFHLIMAYSVIVMD